MAQAVGFEPTWWRRYTVFPGLNYTYRWEQLTYKLLREDCLNLRRLGENRAAGVAPAIKLMPGCKTLPRLLGCRAPVVRPRTIKSVRAAYWWGRQESNLLR